MVWCKCSGHLPDCVPSRPISSAHTCTVNLRILMLQKILTHPPLYKPLVSSSPEYRRRPDNSAKACRTHGGCAHAALGFREPLPDVPDSNPMHCRIPPRHVGGRNHATHSMLCVMQSKNVVAGRTVQRITLSCEASVGEVGLSNRLCNEHRHVLNNGCTPF